MSTERLLYATNGKSPVNLPFTYGLHLLNTTTAASKRGVNHKVGASFAIATLSFRIKGFRNCSFQSQRAENNYGRALVDTPGNNKSNGEEYGYSSTSNRGGTVGYNMGHMECYTVPLED
jgi:hypothetical protein